MKELLKTIVTILWEIAEDAKRDKATRKALARKGTL